MKKVLILFLLIFSFYPLSFLNRIKAQEEIHPGDVVINEMMWMGSSVSSYDEWIELKNTTNLPIDLSNWQITKKSSGAEVEMLTIDHGIIPANDYFLIADYDIDHSALSIYPDFIVGAGDTNDSAFSLLNSNLQIRIYNGQWNDGLTPVDSADDGIGTPLAGKVISGLKWQSMERNDTPGDGTIKENWHTATASLNFDFETKELGTPKAPNSPPPTEPPPPPEEPILPPPLEQPDSENEEIIALISIKDARQKTKNAEVLVEGIVTILPNTFSTHYFYIQDGTAGVQIYFSKEGWPNLAIGQKVRILGTLSESNNEKRIKISQAADIAILDQEKEPEPLALKTGQINEPYEGMLIKTAGKVVEPSGNLFYLDDGSGKIKIYVKKEAKIEKPRLKQGETVQVLGIVSQYKDQYRILPRKTDDLKALDGNVLIKAKIKEIAEESEDIETEEIIPDKETATPAHQNKVLGAQASQTPIPFWPFAIALPVLGVVGYLINDYANAKRTGDATIWKKIRQKIKRWRNRSLMW